MQRILPPTVISQNGARGDLGSAAVPPLLVAVCCRRAYAYMRLSDGWALWGPHPAEKAALCARTSPACCHGPLAQLGERRGYAGNPRSCVRMIAPFCQAGFPGGPFRRKVGIVRTHERASRPSRVLKRAGLLVSDRPTVELYKIAQAPFGVVLGFAVSFLHNRTKGLIWRAS